MFKNTFPSSFYKDLHRYLHKKYRSKQALTELKNIHSNPKDLSQLKIKKVSSYLYHRPAAWYFKKRLQRYTKISID
jgi:anaerobic magnesium-protoporphyrin IX monomethyl ester cyclase